MRANNKKIANAYKYCAKIASEHYENFPVASQLLPRKIRSHVTAIYAFARMADDIADEGNLDANTRMQKLDVVITQLNRSVRGEPTESPIFIAIAHTVNATSLPVEYLTDLISAFKQDVKIKRYENFADIVDYCRRSANPIGRMMLHLSGDADAQNMQYSDDICTALQLINFYQDLAGDVSEKDRVYIPLAEMRDYQVKVEHLQKRKHPPLLRALMHFQYYRAMQMLEQGAPLGKRLSGRMGMEIRAIIEGGRSILNQLQNQTDPYQRPTLSKAQMRKIFRKSLF